MVHHCKYSSGDCRQCLGVLLTTALGRFQHVITGAKSPTAKECLGGIVADEMGLGKSLIMLSAIAGSLDRGFAYARAMTNVGLTGEGAIAGKSTLVLVPSTRKFPNSLLGTLTKINPVLMDSWIEEINRWVMLTRQDTPEVPLS